MEADAPFIFGLLDEGPAPVVMLADEPVDNERRDGEEEEDEDDFNVSWDDEAMVDAQRALVDVRLERVNEWVDEARVRLDRAQRPLFSLPLVIAAQILRSIASVFRSAASLAKAAITWFVIGGMNFADDMGRATVNKVVDIKHSIRDGIWATIETSINLANILGEKIAEHANGFLDIANAVVDNFFHLPLDEEGEVPAGANVKDRVSHLARRLVTLLQTKTRDNILVPAQRRLHGLADQLRKSLALVDVLRVRKDRLNESVNGLWNRVQPGQLSESVSVMWTKVETKAHEAKVNLEWALLRSIHRCSGTLNSYIGKLKEKLVQVLPEAARPRLESVANYVEQLDTNLANAKTVYDLFLMAKSKLQDVSSWASNFRVNGDVKKNE